MFNILSTYLCNESEVSSNSSITAITASSYSSITIAVLRILLPVGTAVLLFLRHESRNEGIKHS